MADWGISAIAARIAAVSDGVGRVRDGLAEAAEHAEQVRQQMLRGGMRGIAAGLVQVKTAIEDAHAETSGIAARIDTLAGAVGETTEDSSPAEVIATLTPVQQELRAVGTGLLAVANMSLRGIEVLIRRILKGGRPEVLLAGIGRQRTILVAVHTRLTKAVEAADATLTAARQVGGEGGPRGGQVPPARPSGTGGGGAEHELFGPGLPIPGLVRHIADEFHHVQPPSRQVAAYLTDSSGRPLHAGRLLSGTDGPGRGGPGLKPTHPVRRWSVVAVHVEGHAAALMRLPEAPREAVLVVSRRPCRERQGCHWALPYVLPSNVTLHVYLAEPGREPVYVDTYRGNGKAVADG